jgi:hypothetical protein
MLSATSSPAGLANVAVDPEFGRCVVHQTRRENSQERRRASALCKTGAWTRLAALVHWLALFSESMSAFNSIL